MHIDVFYTHANSTFKHDMVIKDHLLRDRPHQVIGINGKTFYLCHYGQAGVNRKAAGILNSALQETVHFCSLWVRFCLSERVNCTAYESQRWVAAGFAQAWIREYLFQIPCTNLQVYFNPEMQHRLLVHRVFLLIHFGLCLYIPCAAAAWPLMNNAQ